MIDKITVGGKRAPWAAAAVAGPPILGMRRCERKQCTHVVVGRNCVGQLRDLLPPPTTPIRLFCHVVGPRNFSGNCFEVFKPEH